MPATSPVASSISPAPLTSLLIAQRESFAASPPDLQQRLRALATLRELMLGNERALADAISADFGGRSAHETRLLELLPLADLVRHTRDALPKWMKRKRVGSTWFLLPSRAYVVQQPLGVVGIIGAWNYPLLLTLGPLVDVIAAGNHSILKPSELAPATAGLLARLVADAFPRTYIAVVTGGADVSAEVSGLPFDHLVFTGSTRVGELVMRAASRNLTPVTLELGGKSPAIVHASYPLEKALQRILIGRLLNAGQTCIAPDYVLVPRSLEGRVEACARDIIASIYPRLVDQSDYTHVVNRARYLSLQSAVEDARTRGARIASINPANETCSIDNSVFPPTLVFGAPEDAAVMREEIFGPILPVVTYDSLDDAIAFVNARPRPLALYYFDTDRTRADHVVHSTTSGGVVVNDVLFHIAQHNLPFGGVGPSGMGHYHGHAGFERFSKTKGVMVQSRWSLASLIDPPFTDRKRTFLNRLLRFAAGRRRPP